MVAFRRYKCSRGWELLTRVLDEFWDFEGFAVQCAYVPSRQAQEDGADDRLALLTDTHLLPLSASGASDLHHAFMACLQVWWEAALYTHHAVAGVDAQFSKAHLTR